MELTGGYAYHICDFRMCCAAKERDLLGCSIAAQVVDTYNTHKCSAGAVPMCTYRFKLPQCDGCASRYEATCYRRCIYYNSTIIIVISIIPSCIPSTYHVDIMIIYEATCV